MEILQAARLSPRTARASISARAGTLEALAEVGLDEEAGEHLSEHVLAETVTDKG